ncbi:AMP-binding protein [Nocardioides alkalitolerans]|uniref:AMP-binding protein n=1 Tax=Nocardioides alkalitolerans TaxID=281714 RepID=UPI00041B46A2|nr:AMP-binding protein [Nocardioides alkalitolerans]
MSAPVAAAPVAAAPVAAAQGRDVGWLVETWARRTPDRPFLLWSPFDGDPGRWTRREFAADVDRIAGALHAHGLRPGERFALVLPNGPAFLLTWAAVASLGAVAVCLNPRLSRDELTYALGHSEAVGVLTTPDRADNVALAAPAARLYVDGACGAARGTFAGLLAGDPAPYPRGVAPGAPASIQYTSGTTARPKGVVWSQASALWAGQVGAAHQGLGPGDVNLVHLPLFHTNALSYSFLSTLWSGGALVLQPRFSASRFWPTAVRYGATWSSVVSFCLRALEGHDVPEHHRFRGWGNSAVVTPSAATGGVGAIGWFGMTETVTHPLVSDLHHPGAAGSMGRAASEYDVAVVDDEGRPVVPGGDGELRVRGVRGVSLFSEYLGDAAATAAAFTADGWFRTGDRVRLDEGGDLWFVERDKDVLKVGGENIGAPEIERVLRGVAGVDEVAVVGRPDRMLGEVPVAFVTARSGERVSVEAATAACAELLTDFKRPREIRVVDDLPRSTLDKVAKAVLRTQLAEETAVLEDARA